MNTNINKIPWKSFRALNPTQNSNTVYVKKLSLGKFNLINKNSNGNIKKLFLGRFINTLPMIYFILKHYDYDSYFKL